MKTFLSSLFFLATLVLAPSLFMPTSVFAAEEPNLCCPEGFQLCQGKGEDTSTWDDRYASFLIKTQVFLETGSIIDISGIVSGHPPSTTKWYCCNTYSIPPSFHQIGPSFACGSSSPPPPKLPVVHFKTSDKFFQDLEARWAGQVTESSIFPLARQGRGRVYMPKVGGGGWEYREIDNIGFGRLYNTRQVRDKFGESGLGKALWDVILTAANTDERADMRIELKSTAWGYVQSRIGSRAGDPVPIPGGTRNYPPHWFPSSVLEEFEDPDLTIEIPLTLNTLSIPNWVMGTISVAHYEGPQIWPDDQPGGVLPNIPFRTDTSTTGGGGTGETGGMGGGGAVDFKKLASLFGGSGTGGGGSGGGGGFPAGKLLSGEVKLGEILTKIIPYLLTIAGLLLLLSLIYGGFSLMMSRGDPKAMEAAKGKITNAAIGFAIVFTAYWLVQLLGQILGIEQIKTMFGR